MIFDRGAGRCGRIAISIATAFTCARLALAEPIISEFMAANTKVLADEDGAYSDWIELHNPDAAAVNLAGWYLTDSATNKTKWKLPDVTLVPGGYLLVFASNKDRSNPAAKLHANFALSASGEYLALVRPDGTTVASEFAPGFPAQSDDRSYGRVARADGTLVTGFLRTPTPGASNGGTDALLLIETVAFSESSGIFSDAITVALSGSGPGQDIRFVTGSGPEAALLEVTAESPVYSTPLTLNATTILRAAVFSADGAVRGVTATAHYLKSGESFASFTSKLPVLVLDDLGAGELLKDSVDHPSWLYGYAPKEGDSGLGGRSADVATPLLATVRGSSSAEFPKKGYNLKMRDGFGNKRAVPLFDLPAHDRWALIAPWSYDQNYINNSFVYELSNRIGRWAPRTRLAEVFFNTGGDDLDATDYAGIYVIADRIRIEKGRVEINELSANDVNEPAVTGGYIFKIDPKDEDEIGWRTEFGVPEDDYTSIVLVAPDASDIVPAQIDYLKDYVQRMENALHADRASGWSRRTYLDYIDRPSWVDHHILNVLTNNPDGLHRSAYFTKPRNGKLQAGPVWDFDRALGAYWDDRYNVIDSWSGFDGHVDLWQSGWWGALADDPEFVQAWINRWQTLRLTHFSTPALTALAQSLANSVGNEAAARDAARWPDNASVYGSYAAQIDVLKDWLTRRTEWIDAQFVARPSVAGEAGIVTFTAPPGAMLAYTLDGTDPRLVGGAVAPNARVTSEPLSVASSADVHVRSYNPAVPGGRPSSPWSSAVSGSSATPLSPQSRIANVSSRAVAGTEIDALMVRFMVTDTESKRYLARGIGPGLAAFGASNTIGEPRVRLADSEGLELDRNIGWQNHPAPALLRDAARAVGAFQLADGSADSAIVRQVGTGAYTVEIATTNNQPGVALGELYELDTNGRTATLSLRGRVTPENPLIGGFVVQGSARKRVLIRAVGPGLNEQGIAHALADPVLTVFSSSGIIASNDRWRDDANVGAVVTASQHAGAFPLAPESEDAAVFVVLSGGAYTLEVKGKEGAEGIVLLEIYDLP